MSGLSTRDVWKSGAVEVVFEKTGARRYAVAVHRSGLPALRMDPAPGFDRHFPHDMQHLIVEEQLGIVDGIFGRLANGEQPRRSVPMTPTDSSTTALAPAIGAAFVNETIG